MEAPRYEYEPQMDPLLNLRNYRGALDMIYHRRRYASSAYPQTQLVQEFGSYVRRELELTDDDMGNVYKVIYAENLIPLIDTTDAEAEEYSYRAPLLFVGEFVEAQYFAGVKPDVHVLDWVEEASIVALSRGYHEAKNCLPGNNYPGKQCDTSLSCTLKVVRDFLAKRLSPTEGSLGTIVDLHKALFLAREYLDIANRHQLLSIREYEGYLNAIDEAS